MIKKLFWVHETTFINEICNHPEIPKGKTIDEICQVLYDNGILIRNEALDCWQHWDKEQPELGAFYVLKKTNCDHNLYESQ